MIRKADDEIAVDFAVEYRVLESRLADTEEMIRQSERLCAKSPESRAYMLQLQSFWNRHEKILNELRTVRSRMTTSDTLDEPAAE